MLYYKQEILTSLFMFDCIYLRMMRSYIIFSIKFTIMIQYNVVFM